MPNLSRHHNYLSLLCGEVCVFDWFLPCPSLHSSSCVSSGWFWRWRRSPPPAAAEPSDSAAEGWRRSPARAGGSDSSCRSLWRSQRSRALTGSQLSPVGPHVIYVRSEDTGWSVCSYEEPRSDKASTPVWLFLTVTHNPKRFRLTNVDCPLITGNVTNA